MIFGYGVYEWQTASYPPLVQLTNLHTPVWWGGLLALAGSFLRRQVSPRTRRQVAAVLKNSLVSGHDFSRAEMQQNDRGL